MASTDSPGSRRSERFDLVLFDVFRDGHRRDYFRVLRRVLGGRVAWGSFAHRWPLLLRARKLVCSTCDDYLAKFFVLAFVRMLLGRPTVGLSVRAETIFQRAGFAQTVKRAMLRVLKYLPGAQLVTFMPYWVEPRLKHYTSDWMYDLQYWDLPWLTPSPAGALRALRADLHQRAQGRRIVATVGHQRCVKGVEYFMQIFCDRPEVREAYLFACVGPIWDVDRTLVARFVSCGGVFADRALRDDEVVPIYSMCDLIWVCYRPDYDQSSGIFGRAIQLDRPTVVREGSYLATLQTRLSREGIAVPYDRAGLAAAALSGATSAAHARCVSRPERTSEFLCGLLGVEHRPRPLGGIGARRAPASSPLACGHPILEEDR